VHAQAKLCYRPPKKEFVDREVEHDGWVRKEGHTPNPLRKLPLTRHAEVADKERRRRSVDMGPITARDPKRTKWADVSDEVEQPRLCWGRSVAMVAGEHDVGGLFSPLFNESPTVRGRGTDSRARVWRLGLREQSYSICGDAAEPLGKEPPLFFSGAKI
jgi:hypothetical protein